MCDICKATGTQFGPLRSHDVIAEYAPSAHYAKVLLRGKGYTNDNGITQLQRENRICKKCLDRALQNLALVKEMAQSVIEDTYTIEIKEYFYKNKKVFFTVRTNNRTGEYTESLNRVEGVNSIW